MARGSGYLSRLARRRVRCMCRNGCTNGCSSVVSPGEVLFGASRFWLLRANFFGGGGGIRTCDQGLMSSWLPSLRLSGGVRLRPVSGGKTPSIEESGCRRTRTINREQRLMDVEMDVEVVSPRTVTCRPSKPITARPSSPPIICTILPSTQS